MGGTACLLAAAMLKLTACRAAAVPCAAAAGWHCHLVACRRVPLCPPLLAQLPSAHSPACRVQAGLLPAHIEKLKPEHEHVESAAPSMQTMDK